jgi:hypothetical protein
MNCAHCTQFAVALALAGLGAVPPIAVCQGAQQSGSEGLP